MRPSKHQKTLMLKADRQAHKQRIAEATKRIAAQRAKWGTDGLKIAMLERAWWLLDENRYEEADAILEFLPEKDAQILFERFFETDLEFDESIFDEQTHCAPQTTEG